MNALQNVREGMRVVDASGTDIGTVATSSRPRTGSTESPQTTSCSP